MSIKSRQKTCAGCGRPIADGENVNVEPLVDNNIRYVVTHWGCNTFVYHHHREEAQPSTLDNTNDLNTH